MIEKLYPIKETAEYLGYSEKTIYNLISARKIGAYKMRPVKIPESAIKEFLARQI